MTVSEIRKRIRDLNKEARGLRDKAACSQDLEEVRSINEQLTKINDEIDDLEEKLEGDDSRSNIPEDAKLVNGDIARHAFHPFKGSAAADSASISLRSDETMLSRVPQMDQKKLDLGKYVRGAVTGDWNNAAEERSEFTTTSAGVIIPKVISAQVIDKARAVSLFTAAGVPVVPMISNNLTIARVATDPVFAFKEELAEAEESDFSLEAVELKAKTAYGFAYCSLETIHSAANLTEILYQVFSQAFADMCDRGMLYGQTASGSLVDYAPHGIMNDADINTIVATNQRYDDFIKAIGAIRRRNGVPSVVAMNAATDEQLSLLTDGDGRILEEPKAFAELQKIVSNQLNEDELTGSDALVFDPKAMIIGMQNHLAFRMFTDSDYCIKNGAVGFQIYAMLDCVATQPTHIAKITGIKEPEEVSGSEGE